MNGFGKDFEKTTVKGRIFHSCTYEGMVDLFENYEPGTYACFSTEMSIKLFGRDCVIVMKPKERTGIYTPFDGDAGKNYGWDEFRTTFNPDEVEKIVTFSGRIEAIENLDEDHEDQWMWDFLENNYSLFEESNDEFWNF